MACDSVGEKIVQIHSLFFFSPRLTAGTLGIFNICILCDVSGDKPFSVGGWGGSRLAFENEVQKTFDAIS